MKKKQQIRQFKTGAIRDNDDTKVSGNFQDVSSEDNEIFSDSETQESNQSKTDLVSNGMNLMSLDENGDDELNDLAETGSDLIKDAITDSLPIPSELTGKGLDFLSSKAKGFFGKKSSEGNDDSNNSRNKDIESKAAPTEPFIEANVLDKPANIPSIPAADFVSDFTDYWSYFLAID
jgi:hypothetical protein